MSSIDAKKPEPEKPKTVWDSILTSTPVILTVIATLLAGLSSSEMTRAQYHRALAAQHQSKVSDQWNFFQAKRIRGGNTETEVEMLRAQHALLPVTPELLAECAARLPQDLDRMARAGERLQRALTMKKSDTNSNDLRSAVEKLVQTAHQNAEAARALEKRITEALARSEIRQALGYLGTSQLPEVAKQTVGDEHIHEALEAIRDRKTEAETAPLMARITEAELQTALDAVEANAREFEKKGKPVDENLAEIGQCVRESKTLAAGVHRLADRVAVVLAEIAGTGNASGVQTASNSDRGAELRAAAAALARTDALMMKSAEELNQSFLASRRDFTARRYEREARDNQATAGILEIQVRKSSWNAERHKSRSIMFFYGMLAAQAGVTIATFSLAVRQRSTLWALATLAGLGAIIFSAYIYLYT
jgi:hypothetical protein